MWALAAGVLCAALLCPVRLNILLEDGKLCAQIRWLVLWWEVGRWFRALRWTDVQITYAQRQALTRLAHRARISNCVLHARYSTGDAAQTALLHGLACMAAGFLKARLPAHGADISLQPVFEDQPCLTGEIALSARAPAWAVAVAYMQLRTIQKERARCSAGIS